MHSVTMIGKLAVVLAAAGQANAAVETFGPSFFQSLVPISDIYTSNAPAAATDVPKHQPYTVAAGAAVKVEGEPAILAESGVITTVTVYADTCPMSSATPMVMSSSTSVTPTWQHSSIATLFSTRPTTTPSWTSASGSSTPVSSSSSATSELTTSSPTPNAPGTPTVWTVSAAPPANETSSKVTPAMPTQTHHDSAGSKATPAPYYTASATILVFLVLSVALGA